MLLLGPVRNDILTFTQPLITNVTVKVSSKSRLLFFFKK